MRSYLLAGIVLIVSAACAPRGKPEVLPPPGQRDLTTPLPYDAMAARIVQSLQPRSGEHVIVRYDPAVMPDLAGRLQEALAHSGAVAELLDYGPIANFAAALTRADAYIWLPTAGGPTPNQTTALTRWLESGPKREIHFHWASGTLKPDGFPATHTPFYDTLYINALDVDYAALDRAQDAAIARLRAGEVHVTTPAGTDMYFRLGDRPVSKQNGNGSFARVLTARVKVDKEIELPAGVIRVAPVEESVRGTLVVPSLPVGRAVIRGMRLDFSAGNVVAAVAETNRTLMRDSVLALEPLNHFREFGLGMNPKLAIVPGRTEVPYYGYGAGVVRLSLGDNSELGGKVTGGLSHWMFFPDATVTVGTDTIVARGQLKP
jgi:hypothetical protein